MTERKNLEGLGGWLILVAIGLVLTPIRMLFTFIPLYSEIVSNGFMEAITSSNSPDYSPLVAGILYSEIFLNSLLFIGSLWACYLFFTKKRNFPKVFIALAVFNAFFVLVDAVALTYAMPEVPMWDADTVKEFAASIARVAIWVPYMLLSDRVKATFIK